MSDPSTFNPFPGLRPFKEDEEHLFFGRESQVDTMVDKLARTRFLAVVGTSGSGKSSLVNCGLRPALHRGLMAKAGTSWRIAQFRPGSNPVRAMSRALAEQVISPGGFQPEGLSLLEIVEATLGMSSLGLADLYEQTQPEAGANLLVVADQFEELFRYRQTRGLTAGAADRTEEAVAFVNLLLEARSRVDLPIYVVITMRSDFLGDCAQFSGLVEAINEGQYLVPRMTREQRRAAIAGPVGVGGAEISPVLLNRLINDVGDNPDQLSILQHALNRTWAKWQHDGGCAGPLSLSHYEAVGTMAQALDQHAENAYSELGSDAFHTKGGISITRQWKVFPSATTERRQRICEKIFKALTDRGTDARGIRRPTSFATLCALAGASPAEVTEVLDVFRKPSRSFLMPPLPDVLEPDTVIDISHESLMRVWERLKAWADQEAQSARLYRRLLETALLHAAGTAELWRDVGLQSALDWMKREEPSAAWAELYGGGFDAAMAFLAQSEAQREKERLLDEESRRLELEQAQALAAEKAKSVKHLRMGIAITAVFAVLAAGVAVWAHQLRGIANQQALLADSRRLASDATSRLEQLDLALLLGVQASGMAPTSEAQGSLFQALEYSPALLTFLHGHEDSVRSAAYSPDGARLASGGDDHKIILWDATTGSPLRILKEHNADVNSVAFSPDGARLASGGSDGRILLWDANSGQVIRTLQGHKGPVTSVAYSRDGLRLASGGRDCKIILWDVASGRAIQTLEGHADWVSSVVYSPDGLQLASGSRDRSIILWNAGSGQAMRTLKGHRAGVLSVAFHRDGGSLASGSSDNTIRLWDTRSGQAIQTLEGHTDSVSSVAFSPDGARLASGSRDRSIILWELKGGKSFQTLEGQPNPVSTVAFSPDGGRLVSGGVGGKIIEWDTKGGKTLQTLEGHKDAVNSVAFRADSARVVSGSADGAIIVWDAASSVALRTLEGHKGAVSRAVFTPDGARLASGGSDNRVILWDPASGKALQTLSGHEDSVSSVAFSPNGARLASGSADNTIMLWNANDGQPLQTLKGHKGEVSSVAFSPDGRRLASASRDRTIILWDAGSGQALRTLQGHHGAVSTVAFSPDGALLASGANDNTIILWDARSGQSLRTLEGHSGPVSSVAFSPDGARLASGSSDNTIILWSVQNGKSLQTLVGRKAYVLSVAFSPDGERLASGRIDKKIILWDVHSGAAHHTLQQKVSNSLAAEQDRACRIANRNLTRKEWEDFIGANVPYQRTCPGLPPEKTIQ